MKVRRSAVVAAPVADVWELLADPWSLPRWWPRTERVEAVDPGPPAEWTSVLITDARRTVRADYTVVEEDPPVRRVWRQELAGSPFEKLMSSSYTTVRLSADAAGGSRVEFELDQALRGWARLGGLMVRRAGARQLSEALDGLARLFA